MGRSLVAQILHVEELLKRAVAEVVPSERGPSQPVPLRAAVVPFVSVRGGCGGHRHRATAKESTEGEPLPQ